jgi:hypothetical protein
MQQLYMRSYFGNSGLIAHRSASLLAGFSLSPSFVQGSFLLLPRRKPLRMCSRGFEL